MTLERKSGTGSEGFDVLSLNKEILLKSYDVMKKYNFLPNDAIIISTCLYYNIKLLGSFDSDFQKVCDDEGIALVDDAAVLEDLLKGGR